MAILVLGLAVGVLVGLMGIGGGIVLVPALYHLRVPLHLSSMSQHMAQGTSLFLQLPPIGLGALYLYWKRGQVDWHAGLTCALGFLLGGYFGSLLAIRIPSRDLLGLFGLFLMVAAVLLWLRSGRQPGKREGEA
jgi:uncharacterized membrane protein YfcA